MNGLKKRIVILGGRGMLGTDLSAALRGRDADVKVLDLPEFDITDEKHLAEAVDDAEIIVNCAAYTNVEKAESEVELAQKVNGEAVGTLGCIAREAGVWVLHISTDFVFDGKSDKPYVETDATNPINAYGQSKLDGERLLVESGCDHCIMRIEWTYGSGGNNFVTKLISAAKEKKELAIVDDQVGSPTATTEAAEVICELIGKRAEGLFHYSSDGYVSRFEMAKFMFDTIDLSANLSGCRTADYVSAAQRPLNSCFDCGKIKSLLGIEIKPWQIPLENFLRQL